MTPYPAYVKKLIKDKGSFLTQTTFLSKHAKLIFRQTCIGYI